MFQGGHADWLQRIWNHGMQGRRGKMMRNLQRRGTSPIIV
jgi:hypothetical protein